LLQGDAGWPLQQWSCRGHAAYFDARSPEPSVLQAMMHFLEQSAPLFSAACRSLTSRDMLSSLIGLPSGPLIGETTTSHQRIGLKLPVDVVRRSAAQQRSSVAISAATGYDILRALAWQHRGIHETAGIHHASRRRGGCMADCRSRRRDAAHRRADGYGRRLDFIFLGQVLSDFVQLSLLLF
jgi:hypothetical protein